MAAGKAAFWAAVFLCLGLAYGAYGQSGPETFGAGQTAAGQQGRVRGGEETVSAPKRYTLSPEVAAKAAAYAAARRRVYFVNSAWIFAGLAAAIGLGIAPGVRRRAERLSSSRAAQGAVFFPAMMVLAEAGGLPGAIAMHRLALRYGVSIQGWGSWWADWSKGLALAVSIGSVLLALLYWVIGRSPRRWWLYAWLGAIPIVVFAMLITPWLIDPLFFEFRPLSREYPELADRMEEVVLRAGENIPESRMFVMKASSKLNELNAYVTGVGQSSRIVVWDTAIQRLRTPELLAVFGHEMGHYALGHVWAGLWFSMGVGFCGLYAGRRVSEWAIRRWGQGWKVGSVGDWGSLPVLALAFWGLNFLSTPGENAFSRQIEHQADQYGLEVLHGTVPDAAAATARSFQILGEEDLEELNPSAAVVFWFYSHPPIRDRIAFAWAYDPWSQGRSPEFVK